MKKLKYILFILPFLFGFNVFAKEVDVTSNCYGTTGYASMYNGLEVQYQTDSLYNFGTTYQYQLSSFETELRYSLSANTDYIITFNTNNTNDFRNNFRTYNVYDLNNNNNNLVNGFTFVSMKKVQISFKTTTATNRVKIQMGGSNVYDNITGETNWNIKNAILTIPDTAPSGSTTQDVIDNATNNTNTIVNNQNQNTSDIINNNNNNTQEIKDSITENLNSCRDSYNLLNPDTLYLGNISTETGQNSSGVFVVNSDYISIDNDYNSYSFRYNTYVSSPQIVVYFYDNTKNYIGFDVISNNAGSLSISSNVKFIRVRFNGDFTDSFNFQVEKGSTVHSFEQYGERVCTSKLDDTTNAINETNNYLKDDSDPSISDNEFLSLFNSIGFNDPLANLLQLPVQFINQLVSQSGSCQTVSLGTLWGVSLTLPCIDIGSIVGQQVWDIIDVLFSVGLLVVIIKNLYQTFANLMTMGGEKEAREKFSMPTPMEFLSMILGGDR